MDVSFSYHEAVNLWSWSVAGWAKSLDASGARTRLEGVPNAADMGGSYEGVTRMLWGVGSWLSRPERRSQLQWHGETFDLEELTFQAIINGCDPESVGYWGIAPDRKGSDQRTVETGQIAFTLWQTRERIWNRMNSDQQKNVIAFLDRFGQRPAYWESNWALFWVLNHTARKKLNAQYDQSILDEVIFSYLDGVYCEDGWYDDAGQRGANYFDDYVTWVFASHVMAWAQMDGDSAPERRDILLDRVKAWMQHYPYFFSADGAYCEFGRSLAYKFARLGAPLWAYKLGVWPHSTGMLKRLVGKHIHWYVDRGAVRTDGTLRQSLTAVGSPEIMERYISTGATYWAMQAFGGLWSLADDDPFWTIEEELLPAEQGDFTKVFPQPGWIVTAKEGHIQRFNAGSVKPGYGGKYAKFVYSTRNPFNAGLDEGQPAVDSNLCLVETGIRGQREQNIAFAVGESGWLRMRYVISLNGYQHLVDTTIIPMGDVHLRAHRITLDKNAEQVTALEGSAPVGYDAGAHPHQWFEAGWAFASVYDTTVGIKPLMGYSRQASIAPGAPNSVYGYNMVAVLDAPSLRITHELICLVYAGDKPEIQQMPRIELMKWQVDGQFIVSVNGERVIIPALPQQ